MASRPPKWDWSSHLPKMIEYYNMQMSIPDIYKAIQCDGFEPCQRSVYAKFKAMGYPTDPVGRSRLLEARSPATTAASDPIFTPTSHMSPAPYAPEQHIQSGLCPLPEDQIMVEDISHWHQGHKVNHSASSVMNPSDMNTYMSFRDQLGSGCSNDNMSTPVDAHMLQQNVTSDAAPWASPMIGSNPNFGISTTSFDDAFDFDSAALELNGGEYFGIDTGIHVAVPGIQDSDLLQPKDNTFVWSNPSPFGSGLFNHYNGSGMDIDQEIPSFRDELAQPQPRRSGSFRSASIDIKMPFQNFMATSSTAGTRNRLKSLFRTKSGNSMRSGSLSKKYATSQFTASTQDSGYGSGFGSSLTVDEVRKVNSQSLREFNALYRVACQHLHEPRGKAQCKDIPTCTYCRYSSIHNLGWSARYLKLEVFLSELRLEGVYNFGAVDAAGNSALHYAAAGGASFRHLKALIDTGVNPYAANTAGELFIYCLRPIQPFTLEPNSDCLRSDDLISLLTLLQPERIRDWRDNDGQTILHALYSKISEPALRAKVYEMFLNAGYLPTVRDRFGRTAEDVTPLNYDCHGQVIDSDSIRSSRPSDATQEDRDAISCEDILTADRRSQQVKQIKAQNILAEARRDPLYIDPSSNDNVLHALARLKSSNDTLLNLDHLTTRGGDSNLHKREGNQILLNLSHFIPRGADLNLHNKKGRFPLKAFICDRPWEEAETGATLSKYLDVILWKDSKARIPNQINVNMKDRHGCTALHCAAVRGRPDSVRSLIEAGANVNARSDDGTSVLQATFNAMHDATKHGDGILAHLMKETISYLEHAGAVVEPKSLQERGVRTL